MITALLVIAILVVLIVAHEFGHFIAAKIFGVRVEEFGIGYPPQAFSFGRWGETEYTLNWIPFGGFVRLFGDEGEKEHGRGSFVDASRGVQALILIAGVAANVVLGWGLYTAALHAGIPRIADEPRAGQAVRLLIAEVVPGSPADAAGIRAGDEIAQVQDAKGVAVQDLTPPAVLAFVTARGGNPLQLSYVRAGVTSTVTIIPAHAVIPEAAGRPALGVALVLVTNESLPWPDAAVGAINSTRAGLLSVAHGLWTILVRIVHGAPNLSDVVGPVGLVQVVGDAARSGFGQVLALAGFISVNLAIINLIPIPALDGGRLALVAFEAAARRSAPRLAVQMLNVIGIGLIVFLMITVTYHDIARLLA